MSDSILQVPYGTRDVLPGEAAARRQMEDRICSLFARWGYDEVATPTFEYLDTFAGSGQADEGAFKFFDRKGSILMLRTDMTTPIARMVSTRMRKDTGVKRLSYRAQLFRYEEAQAGRQCEFTQCGIEMMGASGAPADAEVIALAVHTLLEAGLKNFYITLGQMEFINGLIEAAALTDEQAKEIKHCLIKRNAAGLELAVESAKIPEQLANIFKDLLFLHGGVELLNDMQQRVLSRRCWNALENLREIYELAKAYDVAQYLSFDLGLTRSLDYYTGMLFEGYAAGMGYSLIGGGRYDNMMQRFGKPCPATGFALGIDRIALTLQRQGSLDVEGPETVLVAYAEGKTAESITLACSLRKGGRRVRLADRDMTEEEARQAAKENHCVEYRYVKG
ncbi:MAG: ATP phosphoribosyltransferase regulatory subunit [Acidaminococcaceae bacterium]|nr:ATP phosphoribosyltransferase regulatory subunit [Acidaminococcaceae bacterium]MBQ9319831.1 ATP phosphoribosyltransferase regulatory subunit [Acidaminococcaceae bacterium]